jgi:hypothetical protein
MSLVKFCFSEYFFDSTSIISTTKIVNVLYFVFKHHATHISPCFQQPLKTQNDPQILVSHLKVAEHFHVI